MQYALLDENLILTSIINIESWDIYAADTNFPRELAIDVTLNPPILSKDYELKWNKNTNNFDKIFKDYDLDSSSIKLTPENTMQLISDVCNILMSSKPEDKEGYDTELYYSEDGKFSWEYIPIDGEVYYEQEEIIDGE